jgi:hypothetical protein
MIWIALAGVLVCLAVPLLILSGPATDDGEDYGTVSGSWIAAHRAPDDQER